MYWSAEYTAAGVWAAGLTTTVALRYLSGVNPATNPLFRLSAIHPILFWSFALGAIAVVSRRFAAGRALPPSIVNADLTDKNIVVTGSTTGLGYESALFFATRGATVVLGNRSVARNEDTAKKLRAEAKAQGKELKLITRYAYDAENLGSVKAFAESLLAEKMPLHVLMNNAGLMNMTNIVSSKFHPQIEYTECINVYAPILLTELLLPKIRQDKTRVVNLSSYGHNFATVKPTPVEATKFLYYEGNDAATNPSAVKKHFGQNGSQGINYCTAKLQNLYYSNFLVSRGIDAVSVHPGVVASNFYANILPASVVEYVAPFFTFKTSEEGGWTQIYASLVPFCDESRAKREKEFIERVLQKNGSGGKLVNREAIFYTDCDMCNEKFVNANGRNLDFANDSMEFIMSKLKPFM